VLVEKVFLLTGCEVLRNCFSVPELLLAKKPFDRAVYRADGRRIAIYKK